MQKKNIVFIETYFGLDGIEGVQNLLETGVVVTTLKNNKMLNDYHQTKL